MNNEEMIAHLEETGDFKVLRRVIPRAYINKPDGSETRCGLYVDVETTGLSTMNDEIIELAMVPFDYGLDGRIFEIHQPFQSFNEPEAPILEEITKITGIDQSMVQGHKIDKEQVDQFLSNADIIIAHNASFDRRFLERLSHAFTMKPWACSATQIDWREEGFEGSRLGYLVAMAGFFYDRHRALNDCYAALELLAQKLPKSGKSGFETLLKSARSTSHRIWAINAPFELKDNLKRRGYRWNNGENGTPRSWYIDVSAEKKDAEITFLQQDIYGWEAPIHTTDFDAYDRFSVREG